MKTLIRRLIPLRARHQLRLLLHRYPYELRARFADLADMRLPLRPVVFDVGANVGYFAEAVLAYRPFARLHLFEPLPDAFSILEERLGVFGGLSINNVALGSERGRGELLVSRFGEASSFLEQGTVLRNRVYGIDFTIDRRIDVEIETLTTYVRLRRIEHIHLLKLDVQGFELEVLKGGAEVLACVDWIYAEVQFLELYRNAPSAHEVAEYLESCGFEAVGRTSLRYDDAGNLMECDMIFRRRR